MLGVLLNIKEASAPVAQGAKWRVEGLEVGGGSYRALVNMTQGFRILSQLH